MILTAERSWPRPGLLTLGLAAALALRLVIAGESGASSAPAGLVFGAALVFLSIASGWRPRPVRAVALAAGIVGAVGLVAGPVWLHLNTHAPVLYPPLAGLWVWAPVVSFVAVAEEMLFRGALFGLVEAAYGSVPAVAVTTIAFALLHVPLYGLYALPLDLAVGVWLGGLRVISGGVAAPAVAHVLADLAAWWLV